MLLPLPAGSPLFISEYSHLENKYKWARETQVLSLENGLFEEMVRISNSELRMIPQRVLPVKLAWASQCKLDSAAKGSQALCLKCSNGFSLHLEWNPIFIMIWFFCTSPTSLCSSYTWFPCLNSFSHLRAFALAVASLGMFFSQVFLCLAPSCHLGLGFKVILFSRSFNIVLSSTWCFLIYICICLWSLLTVGEFCGHTKLVHLIGQHQDSAQFTIYTQYKFFEWTNVRVPGNSLVEGVQPPQWDVAQIFVSYPEDN